MTSDERFDELSDIYERLNGDARMHHVAANLLDPKSPEDLQQTREFVNNVIAQGIINQRQLTKRTGIKPTAVNTFLNDTWKGKQGTLYTTAGMLVRAIDELLKQRTADETSIAGFTWIRLAEEAYAVVQYCVKRRKMGGFIAPAGSGKSLILSVAKDMIPGAVLIVVRKCRSSVKAFLQLWARELGLQEHGRAEDIQDRIIRCLAGSDRLVLIDEAHKLQVATLDVVREVWDEVKCPIVMAGTPSFKQTLTTQRVGVQSTELMDQLYSRVVIFHDLSMLENPETGEPEPQFSAEDIRRVFARGHVRLLKDGVDFLHRLANTPGAGALRACADLVQTVVDLYPNEPITAVHLNTALQMKVGTREAAFRMNRAGVSQPALAKAAVG